MKIWNNKKVQGSNSAQNAGQSAEVSVSVSVIDLTGYNPGRKVICGMCDESTSIEYVAMYDGKPGFELACGHRNSFCAYCRLPAADISETADKVVTSCRNCLYRFVKPTQV